MSGMASSFVLTWAVALLGQLPPGYELVRITDDPDFDNRASLNNCGEIVFSKRLDENTNLQHIFVYDNGRTIQITDVDDFDANPDLNDRGTLVWTRRPDGFGRGTITKYENGVVTELFPGSAPSINNLGHIAWLQFDPDQGCTQSGDGNIFLFDGREVRQITRNDSSNQVVDLNDVGDLVWVRFDFCENPWTSDIMMYSDGEIMQLTEGHIEPNSPAINNGRQVAWVTKDRDFNRFLQIWEDGETSTLTDWGSLPQLNESGQVAFYRWYEEQRTRHTWLYRDGDFFLITDQFHNWAEDINDHGEVVIYYQLGILRSDLAFLRRIRTGDSEFDGDIDQDDLAKLVDCMTGPMWVERTNPGPEDSLCDCRFLDINHDGSVDLRDYAIFQENYAGQP